MANAEDPQQTFFAAGLVEVEALNRAGRWQEALAAGAYLFEQFRAEPRACLGLVETLVALDRADQAEAVLRDARARFPGQPTLAVRLAELAARRGAWAEAVAHWRDAGLPQTGNPAHLRAFALAVARAGDPQAALRLVETPVRGRPESRVLLLAQAELHLQAGHVAAALALWRQLVVAFTLEDANFATLTGTLALQADAAAAAPLFDALVCEPDPGTQGWVPAIAGALAGLDPADAASDPVHDRVRQALLRHPDATTALGGLVAESLAGVVHDPDALASRVGIAVGCGRMALLPLLLETGSLPARVTRLRVALRLYLNRTLARPEGLEALGAAGVVALMQAARVIDPDCLSYVAELARARLPPPAPPASFSLRHAEDVMAQVAYGVDRPPAAPVHVQQRLRVAVCVQGRLPMISATPSLLRALRFQAHDAVVFAHVWRHTGGTERAPPGIDAVLGRLPSQLGAAFAAACDSGGLAALARLYPALLQGRPPREVVEPAQVAAMFHTDHVVVEDDTRADLAQRAPVWKARHAARQAHLMAVGTGAAFDLFVHVPADAGIAAADGTDWVAIARQAQQRRVMFADGPYRFDRSAGLAIGSGFGIGSRETMDLAADSFVLGEQVATAQAHVFGYPPADAVARSLAMQLQLQGVAVETLPQLALGVAASLDPVAPAAALALLWQDIRGRPAASSDSALVRAAMADVTGGLGI